jgi:hypothetical protein
MAVVTYAFILVMVIPPPALPLVALGVFAPPPAPPVNNPAYVTDEPTLFGAVPPAV